MTERKWVPAEYQDEVVPPGRSSPNDWITRMSDGAPALASGDPSEDDDVAGRALKPGEVVDFDWVETYGQRSLTFRCGGDGWTWELDGDEPIASPGGDMTVAEVGNWESMMPGLEDFASAYAKNGVEDGETITVLFYAWSHRHTPFVFREGAFHEIAPVAA